MTKSIILLTLFWISASANVLNTRNRIQELNDVQKHTSKKTSAERPHIESIPLMKDQQGKIEPQVLLFPTSAVPSTNLVGERELPTNVIVSSSLDNLLLGALIHPPRPGATKPPTTTPSRYDSTSPVLTTTPLAIKDVPKAPQAASFQGATWKGQKLNEKTFRDTWVKPKEYEVEDVQKIKEKLGDDEEEITFVDKHGHTIHGVLRITDRRA